MKYIEKDKAYKIVLHYGSYAASAKISDLPSIDLVRCRDCKHRTELTTTKWHPCVDMAVNDDWFCADGERREE